MIIKKQGTLPDKLVQSAKDLAIWLRLEIVYRENTFSLKAAIEDDDEHWFNLKTFNLDDYDEFIVMCEQYGSNTIEECLPEVEPLFKLSCTRCSVVHMTKEQIEKNTVNTGNSKVVACINCGQLINVKL